MGTNFYARKIPTKERKSKLYKLIEDSNDFDLIKREINKTYGEYTCDYEGNLIGGEIHLGKRSAGWKFLWNPNINIIHNGHSEINENGGLTWVSDPDTYHYLYPLTKEGIWNFINEPDIVIYDEYGDKQDKEEFFEEAVNWTTWRGKEAWDSKTYTEYERSLNPNWKIYSCSGEYTNMLEKEGFKFISEDKSDFYSDGLRFASYNEFS